MTRDEALEVFAAVDGRMVTLEDDETYVTPAFAAELRAPVDRGLTGYSVRVTPGEIPPDVQDWSFVIDVASTRKLDLAFRAADGMEIY